MASTINLSPRNAKLYNRGFWRIAGIANFHKMQSIKVCIYWARTRNGLHKISTISSLNRILVHQIINAISKLTLCDTGQVDTDTPLIYKP